ncbi:peptidyl-Lys metalloendopeptidase [Macrolepiota fuliginosa MF-IS2]|uniref:Peptidyl-Lys metalloendopeptidase n=1 Tax=Macrolepiota fuliginosa MF-IS2 TaxID=1400762 RepID=A0A9P5XF39_9AGAR|nr:peptidyl-Lys metalloendopeptidase [Macrolepiota fuliginosa MF-IS2]
MFSSTIRSALLAVAVSAAVANAARSLSLKVAGPASVDGVDNLKVTTTLTNDGDETLKLLNDPLSPISQLPAETFQVTSDSTGAKATFSGIKVKYIPEVAAANLAFTVLEPGKSIEVAHDLSTVYNFTAAGEGSYSFEARNLFYFVDDSAKVGTIYAKADAHTAHVSGKLSKARESKAHTTSTLQKRASYVSCSSSEQTSLVAAASAAQTYAANAYSYLSTHTAASARYTTWFGSYTSSRHSTALSHFSAISGGSFSSFTFDCSCTDSGVYAYVYPDDYGYIYLCPVFWQVATTGTDSKGGTLIHETSHFTANGGTEDYVYGQSSAKSLAISNPDEAVFNADNHEYFAENNPSQS